MMIQKVQILLVLALSLGTSTGAGTVNQFYRLFQKSHPNFSDLFQLKLIDTWLDRVTSRPSFEQVIRKS